MALEMRKLVIAGGVMTGTTVITSTWIKIQKSMVLCFQAKWTNTPNGVFSFEISNDDDPNKPGDDNVLGATALTLPASFAAGNPAGAAGSFGFEFADLAYVWIRIKYTNASSTGVLNVGFSAKGAA